MHDASHCMTEGLKEACLKVNPNHGEAMAFRLGFLEATVGYLIEGNTKEKLIARNQLKKMIGRGRCILNAVDFAKKAKSINLDVSGGTLPEQQL